MLFKNLNLVSKWLILGVIALFAIMAISVQADNADDVSVTQTVSPDVARPGATVVYTVEVSYTGDEAQEVSVKDDLSSAIASAVTLSSTRDGATFSSAEGMAWSGSLEPDSSVTVVYTVTLSSELEDGDTVEGIVEAEAGTSTDTASTVITIDTAGPLRNSTLTTSNEIIGAGRDRQVEFMLDSVSEGVKGTVEIVVDSALTLDTGSVSVPGNVNGGVIQLVSATGNTIELSFNLLSAANGTISFDVSADDDAVEGTEYDIVATITQDGATNAIRDLTLTAGSPDFMQFMPMVFFKQPIRPLAPTLSVTENSQRNYTLKWTEEVRVQANATVAYALQESSAADFASFKTVYEGANRELAVTDKENGTYYYRVIARETFNGTTSIGYISNVTQVDINSAGFFIDDDTLKAGECTTLHWEFENISEIRVNFAEGFTPVGVQGGENNSGKVCPGVDTTYRAVVKGTDDKETEYKIEVDVTDSDGCNDGKTDPYFTEVFTAEDTTVPDGQRAKMSWKIQCANAVYFKAGNGPEKGVQGESTEEFTITGDTIFRLRVSPNTNYSNTTYDNGERFLSFLLIEEE